MNGSCECKPHSYGENCERTCDLNCLEEKVYTLTNDKATLEQKLTQMTSEKAALEQNWTDHRTATKQKLDDHKSEVVQALEEQMRNYKYHLTLYLSLVCAIIVLLFVGISLVYLKNEKANHKVASVRYSKENPSDSISVPKVTFSCTESLEQNSLPGPTNMFSSVRNKLYFLTRNLPSSTDQPIYETSLLEETDRINESIYAAIDNLKEQNELTELNASDAIRIPEN